jgi:phosphoribosyl-AMP cyclohydrolase
MKQNTQNTKTPQFMIDLTRLKTRTVDGVSGLILVIAQDFKTNDVLMAAFANKEAVEKTLSTGKAHYFSTSRKQVWLKGETSGHVQMVKEIYFDCDMDALLVKVEQTGGACHTGYRSCFYRKIVDGELRVAGLKVFEPDEVY